MSRIKIDLPERFTFTTTIPIRITDINYGGHVGNDTVLTIIHEARMQYLKSHGYTEMDFGGVGMIMADAAIEFKREMFYGDSVKVQVTAANISKAAFDLYYKLEIETAETTSIVALAKTGMVCYDYSKKKITAIPQVVCERLKA